MLDSIVSEWSAFLDAPAADEPEELLDPAQPSDLKQLDEAEIEEAIRRDDLETRFLDAKGDKAFEVMQQGAACLFFEKDNSGKEGGDNLLAPLYPDATQYVPFRSVMDSGASDHVHNGSDAPEVAVEPSPGSQAGLTYGCAGGQDIANEGQQVLPLVTNDGHDADLTYQVADVAKNLTSVSKICDKGNRIIFGRGGGLIQNLKSGIVTPFRRQGGIYVIDLWLDRKKIAERQRKAPFTRQGPR